MRLAGGAWNQRYTRLSWRCGALCVVGCQYITLAVRILYAVEGDQVIRDFLGSLLT